MTEEQQTKILEELKQVKELGDYYFKQYQETGSKTAKSFTDNYQGQETGICKVLDILGIDY